MAQLLLLLLCFFLSGFAALLYQTAWAQELSFVFGTSELAVAAVLASYMGGLALGAAVAARLAPVLRRPLLVYGLLEAGIALFALAVPWGIRGIDAIYVAWLGGEGLDQAGSPAATVLQVAGAFAVLLPATACMGATLPLLARHAVHRDADIGPRVGLLYATNTAGAVAGTLCAAFLLLPLLGLRNTVWVGVALNLAVFALVVPLARRSPHPIPPAASTAVPAARPFHGVLPAMAVSGAVSFAYEVLWTRLLGHLLGGSLHAFATMLASFLLGIALGSAVAARLAHSRRQAAQAFAIAQLGIALSSCLSFALADRLPELARALGAGPGASLPSAGVAMAVLLPITLCIGATFPLAVRWLAEAAEQTAAATARVYAWNTCGAIAGALGAGFVLLPALGFHGTLAAGVLLSLALALGSALSVASRPSLLAGCALALAAVVALWPARPPWKLIGASSLQGVDAPIAFSAVGRSSTVVVFEHGRAFRMLTNGLPESAVDRRAVLPRAFQLVNWLTLLPGLARPEARDMLIIGLGGGVAAESVPSSFERVDVIELEAEVLEANRWMAPERARDPLSDPRIEVYIGDARGTMRLSEQRYDAIVSQPSHPWTAGASHLYTREFFELVHSRLRDDGVFVQWIGYGFVDEELLRTLLSALVAVFEQVEIYEPARGGILFAASDAPIDAIAGARVALDRRPADFARFGLHRVEELAAMWRLGAEGARAVAEGVAPNTDDHNQLAVRAAGLGKRSLLGRPVPFYPPHDPLLEHPELFAEQGLDRSALILRVLDQGEADRASRLAQAAEGIDRWLGAGWTALSRGLRAKAGQSFQRALEEDPDNPDARLGLFAAGQLTREAELEEPYASLLRAGNQAGEGDWAGVAAADGELAAIAPGLPFFEEAARLRIRWRLELGGAEEARAALALAEPLLTRSERASDDLLHARVAHAAGEPRRVWAALHALTAPAKRPQLGARAWRLARQLAAELPPELRESLDGQLASSPGR